MPSPFSFLDNDITNKEGFAMDIEQAKLDLANIISQNPVTVTHSGQTFDALFMMLETDKVYLPEGAADKYAGSISAVTDAVTTSPEAKDAITIGSSTYRVTKVIRDSCGVRIKLLLRLDAPTTSIISA